MSSTPGTKQVFQQESSEGHSWSGEIAKSDRSARPPAWQIVSRVDNVPYHDGQWSAIKVCSRHEWTDGGAGGNPVRHTDSTARNSTEQNGEERRNGLRWERATCARKRCGGDRGPPSLSRSGRVGPGHSLARVSSCCRCANHQQLLTKVTSHSAKRRSFRLCL